VLAILAYVGGRCVNSWRRAFPHSRPLPAIAAILAVGLRRGCARRGPGCGI